jgi:D-amino peptidase
MSTRAAGHQNVILVWVRRLTAGPPAGKEPRRERIGYREITFGLGRARAHRELEKEVVMSTFLKTLLLLLLAFPLFGQTPSGLKVFISVDMEGLTGVSNWEDVSRTGKDYDFFRKVMTQEANAAVEGALAAGATDIWVRDSHGSARNILPDLLHRSAMLFETGRAG